MVEREYDPSDTTSCEFDPAMPNATCSNDKWVSCGLSYYNYALPSFLWFGFLLLTIISAWQTQMHMELQQSVEQLHDIQTQGREIG